MLWNSCRRTTCCRSSRFAGGTGKRLWSKVLSDTPIGCLPDFGVNENFDQRSRFLAHVRATSGVDTLARKPRLHTRHASVLMRDCPGPTGAAAPRAQWVPYFCDCAARGGAGFCHPPPPPLKIRTPADQVPAGSSVIQTCEATEGGHKIPICDKVAVGAQLSRMCGWFEPEKFVIGAADSLTNYLADLRVQPFGSGGTLIAVGDRVAPIIELENGENGEGSRCQGAEG